jgi:hypothetical protein
MPPDPDRSRPLSESLIGTWELLTREDHTSSGERRIDPHLGEDPVALLIYDRDGHFAAQFMKRDRDAAPPTESRVAGPNNSRARGGYDAYFGTYSTDDASSTVTQCLVGALAPENVGLVLTRVMAVVGDELTIRLDTETDDGEAVTRTLKWKRAGS